MTRREFLEDVTEFGELRDFANDNEIWEPLEDLADEDDIDREANDAVSEMSGHEEWHTIKDYLDGIPDYAGWFIREGYLDYVDATQADFDRLKQDVLEAADELWVWDDEEVDDDYEDVDGYDDDEDDADEDAVGESSDLDSGVVMAGLFGQEAIPA